MGWVWILAIGIAAAALLVLLRLPRLVWSFAAATLMLGAAGCLLQGNASQPSAPATPDKAEAEVDPSIIALRGQMFGLIGLEQAYLTGSDAFMRAGDTQSGVQYVEAGLKQSPRSALLWTGLGETLSQHDGNTLSPAALFAYRRAISLAPDHPGPYFFLGVSAARAGDLAKTREAWARALALTPPNASYRGEIAMRLALLDQVLAASR